MTILYYILLLLNLLGSVVRREKQRYRWYCILDRCRFFVNFFTINRLDDFYSYPIEPRGNGKFLQRGNCILFY